jgi:serine/threonine protein kinase
MQVTQKGSAMQSMEIGRFQVIRVLGTGAEGVVALAHDRADASPEPVVLKVLKQPAAAPASLARLRREARILAWLSHPNIVKVHRLLEKDGRPIVVMEHVEGTSAAEQLARCPDGLPVPVAVEIAHRAAQALDAAWNAPGPSGRPMRIVHRDIKPANLVVSVAGEVKVVDFGIAAGAFDDAAEDGDGAPGGTPGYIAPERRNGGAEGSAVDVYALGATLFGMLSGKLLVQPSSADEHDPALARALAHLSPADVEQDVVEALRALVGEMCRFDPDARPALPELARRLEALSARLAPDLKAFADATVAPVLRERARARAKAHPDWPDLEFLESAGDVRDEGVPTDGPVRGLALRAVQAPADVDELLARIARRPWWAVWQRGQPADQIAEVLVALRGTRDPRALTRAFELTEHEDPRVVDAAWELLAEAC